MRCDTHQYEGELPCPWPDCPRGTAAAVPAWNRVDLSDREEFCVIGDPRVPAMPHALSIKTYVRKRWRIACDDPPGDSLGFLWERQGGPPDPRRPRYSREQDPPALRLVYGSTLQRWIDTAATAKLACYQTLDARTVNEIVMDAVGPWIGFAVIAGTLVIAWFCGPGAQP